MKKLSLKVEMDKEAKKIEEDILNNPDLKDIKVSNDMDAELLSKIRAFEKKHAMEHNNANCTEEEFSAEFTGETPNVSKCTNDNNVVHLSEEDVEALRLGRELLKMKNREDEPSKINQELHKHLQANHIQNTQTRSVVKDNIITRLLRKILRR